VRVNAAPREVSGDGGGGTEVESKVESADDIHGVQLVVLENLGTGKGKGWS